MRSAWKREKSSHGGRGDDEASDFDDSLHGTSSHGQGGGSGSKHMRAFKGVNNIASTDPMQSGSSHGGGGPIGTPRRGHIPGATVINDEKRKAKADADKVYFTSIGVTIAILLILIIFSLEGLQTEEEIRYAAYPQRLEEVGFRQTQLKATARQMFLEGTLNLSMFISNETSSVQNLNTDISSVLETSLERCSHQWTDDKLNGKCYGLQSFREYQELSEVDMVPSPTFCKALCCELKDKCHTWQYLIKNYPQPRPSETECFLGGPVSVINELNKEAPVDKAYCELKEPQKWRGKQLVSRTVNNQTNAKPVRSTFGKEFNCEWGIDLPAPCSGLGKERTLLMYRNSSDKVGQIERLSRKQCAASCCSTVGCTNWQEQADRGCFHNDKSSGPISCDAYQPIYTGGIKIEDTSMKTQTQTGSSISTNTSAVIIIDKKKPKNFRGIMKIRA